MLLTFIILYLAVTLLIGWWASRKVHSTADFVIAGKNLPTPILAAGLFATWFGSETVMGAPSSFIEGGLLGVMEDPFGAAMCLILVGLIYARPLYRLNILTFNDFYRMRFNRTTEIVSAIFMVPSYFGWIAAQLVALAIVMKSLVGLPLAYGILLCTVITVIYTYIGGMWAVSITDFVQTIMIVIGLAILTYVMYQRVGGWHNIQSKVPKDFFRFLPHSGWNHWIEYLAAWMTIGLGSIPQQDVFQRVMSARNAKIAVRACIIGGVMYLTIGFMPLLIGLCGRILYPEMLDGDPQMILPEMVLAHGSLALQILFFGALLSAILSTTSGAMLAPATVLGENLVKPFLKNPTDKMMLNIMRTSVVFVAICAAIMANLKSNIYELVGDSSSLSLVSLFVPLTAGLFWKRASSVGAVASMLIGMAVWVFYEYIQPSEIPSLVPGLMASILAMIIGSLFWKDQSYADFTEEAANRSGTV
ncbi:sodium:solute symporter family protein [Haliscomenobacter hydrossis]|uniref:SSS sodium solute transporter superfamily n=1 Tax=Haliscomenobacter hydrossis (strain ATCC 27775 / DSM 1100 / LMG 10767 / O) TaxID=760192 RepID=F4KZP7_HALH1|nr:sodium:solute symporter family protein [Haliscomenobacter hydrossis]AEE50483.1 SSS sodium solute transporter superfamily [Haliscomenobacter hydrossis DSM 1100]